MQDLDNDGWDDLILTGDFGTSEIFWNNKNGTFFKCTKECGITAPAVSSVASHVCLQPLAIPALQYVSDGTVIWNRTESGSFTWLSINAKRRSA